MLHSIANAFRHLTVAVVNISQGSLVAAFDGFLGRLRPLASSAWDKRAVKWPLSVLLAGMCLSTNAQAQFGLKCDTPEFDSTLGATNFSDDIQAAIRATCAFEKKNAEIHVKFGKVGWSWDLLPKAEIDIAELKDLADKAAELNFKTNDTRALGNLRRIYIRLGDLQRWLADSERKYAARDQTPTNTVSGTNAPLDPSQANAGETLVSIIFQDNISDADKAAFLSAYSVSIVDGPAQDQSYRLRLGTSLPPDQLQLVLDSMNSQTKVVKNASAK